MIPKILLIYTGGTIGMIKNSQTGALQAFDFENLSHSIPELNLIDCEIEAFSFDTPLDSSDMHPKYWLTLAEIIEEKYSLFDGFVILHGSDTMSYTASALSFMLKNLAKPVILTGSQLPIGDLRTDAKENLITTIQIAALQKNNKPAIQEVGLYFEYKLYRGNRTTKINAEHFQAFASLNYPHLAESGVNLKVNNPSLFRPKKQKPLEVLKKFETRIILIKLFPGINKDLLIHQMNIPNIKGVILETYGAGNATTIPWFLEIIKNQLSKGIPVVNVSQCSGGSVVMGKYETSRALKKLGVISGNDMTTEAALAKMMILLPLTRSLSAFKNKFEKPICGELSKESV